MTERTTKVIKDFIETAETEIAKSDVLIGFYQNYATTIEDKEENAKTLLKAKQLEQVKSYNTKLIEYLKSL